MPPAMAHELAIPLAAKALDLLGYPRDTEPPVN